MNEFDYNDKLSHYGVLGMKWGRKRGPKPNHSFKREKTKRLSNSELKERITRMELEQRYNSLSRSSVSRGRAAVTSTLSRIGSNTVTSVISGRLANGINKGIDSLFDKNR